MNKAGIFIGCLVAAACGIALYYSSHRANPPKWSARELELISSLWIDNLPPLPSDTSNKVVDNPKAVALGRKLFSDSRLSINQSVSCATCHQSDRSFTDGLDQGQAIGKSRRNTPSIIGIAYSPWLYWDGRKDSLWSQALSPLEDPAEHGGNRLFYAHLLHQEEDLHQAYEEIFGQLYDFSDRSRFPDHATPEGNPEWISNWEAMTASDQHLVNKVFSNLGKAIGAYERSVLPEPTRFDRYAGVIAETGRADTSLLTVEEQQGLALFIGEARCMECHNGPLFTNHEFHNTGLLSYPGRLPDRGRIDGIRILLEDPFNCKGEYSDATPESCLELEYARTGIDLLGAFKTPSLRNLAGTAPFMHQGQHKTLQEVLEHYNAAEDAMIGHNEAEPLNLSRGELKQLEAFLLTLQ